MPINTGINDNFILPLAHFCIEEEVPRDNPECCPAWFGAPMLDEGTATPGQRYLVTSFARAVELFGEGSIAADMAYYYLRNYQTGELWITGLEDTGVASTGSITIDTVPNEDSGSLYLRIASETYIVPVFIGDTTTDVAEQIAFDVNNDTTSLVTASVSGSTVVFTAKNSGSQGDDIPILVNVFFGENSPEGLTWTIEPMSGGGGAYALDEALEALGCCCYDFMAMPFSEVTYWQEINKNLLQRWDCTKLIGGHWYGAYRGSFDELINLPLNYTHGSIISLCETATHASWQKLAAVVGRAHQITCGDPVRRWYGPLIGIDCETQECGNQCFSDTERNLLVQNGISTTKCGQSGTEEIEMVVSAAEDFGIDQVGFFPQNYYTTLRFFRELKNFIEGRFSTSKIVDTLETQPDGSNVVTLPIIVAEIRAWAQFSQSDLIENTTSLNEFIQIEINPNNPYRVDMCITIDLINAIRQFAIKLVPRLRIIPNTTI